MVLWGGVAAALVLLLVGIVFVTRDDDNPNASVQTLPNVTLSTPSSDVSVETVVATTVVPATVAPTSELPTTIVETTLAPTTLAPTTLAPATTVLTEGTGPPDDGGNNSLPPGIPYSEYVSITDDSGLIEMSVPVEWSDIDGRPWESDLATGVEEFIGSALSASPNVDAMRDTWGTPGAFLGASPSIERTVDELLDESEFREVCAYDGRFDYEDGLYTGRFDSYSKCGPEGSDFLIAFVQPADAIWTAMLQIVAVTEADREAASTVIESFMIEALAG